MGEVLQRNGGTGSFQPKTDASDKPENPGIQRVEPGIAKDVVETKDGPKEIIDQREPSSDATVNAQPDPSPSTEVVN